MTHPLQCICSPNKDIKEAEELVRMNSMANCYLLLNLFLQKIQFLTQNNGNLSYVSNALSLLQGDSLIPYLTCSLTDPQTNPTTMI